MLAQARRAADQPSSAIKVGKLLGERAFGSTAHQADDG